MTTQDLFWTFAVAGTSFFVLRSILMLLGMSSDHDGALGHGSDGHGTDGHSADGHEGGFRLVSMFSVSGFFMAFGWGGLSAMEDFGYGPGASIFFALLAGSAVMVGTAYLFRLANKLTSDGSVFSLEQTVGQSASVYERIPAEGEGRVQMPVAGMLREIRAVSERKEPIESHQRVRVTRIVDQETVAVEPAV